MDVVTAKRADWQRDPYHLIEENGYFFGRGTADVKQEVALLTTTFLTLRRRASCRRAISSSHSAAMRKPPKRPPGTWSPNIATSSMRSLPLNADGGGGVLSEDTGKPLLFYVQGAEKSSAQFLLTTRNPGGHSSMPRADNAIYELADALKAVQHIEFPVIGMIGRSGISGLRGAVTSRAARRGHAALRGESARFGRGGGNREESGLRRPNPHDLRGHDVDAAATRKTRCPNRRPRRSIAAFSPALPPPMCKRPYSRGVGPKVEVTQGYEALVSDASPMRADIMAAVARAVAAADPGARVVPTQAAYATDGAVYQKCGYSDLRSGGRVHQGQRGFRPRTQ